MLKTRILVVTVALLAYSAATTLAKPPATKPSRPTPQVSSPQPKGPKTVGPTRPAGAPKTQGGGPRSTTPVKSSPTVKTSPSVKTTKKTTTASATTTAASTPVTTTTTSPNLPRNQKLVDRLAKLLPLGTDMNDASLRFKNQGQFIAAVRVSNNLGIPFAELKTRVVDEGLSLGQAIQSWKLSVDAGAEVARAEAQAREDLASTKTVTGTTSQTTTAKKAKKPKTPSQPQL